MAIVFAFVGLGGAMLASFTDIFTTKILLESSIIFFILVFTAVVLSVFTVYFYCRSSGRI